jgi:hypothetical protein
MCERPPPLLPRSASARAPTASARAARPAASMLHAAGACLRGLRGRCGTETCTGAVGLRGVRQSAPHPYACLQVMRGTGHKGLLLEGSVHLPSCKSVSAVRCNLVRGCKTRKKNPGQHIRAQRGPRARPAAGCRRARGAAAATARPRTRCRPGAARPGVAPARAAAGRPGRRRPRAARAGSPGPAAPPARPAGCRRRPGARARRTRPAAPAPAPSAEG